MSRRPGRPGALAAALLAVAALVLLPAGRAVADGPTAAVDRAEAGKGGSVTVTGSGWRPGALLTLLICGQNMVGGTNDCANGDGRAVTVGDDGRFSRKLPVAEPPKPCPCVVHVATVTTVTGERAAADAAFRVAGHPVRPLPRQTGRERLSVLGARLEGSSGLLTWFGAPPRRKLVVTVGNLGSTPARDPVFRVGTAHGVLAPAWEEQRWRGTVPAGAKARVALDVELAAGAHGDYAVSLEYGGKLLVEQPWDVPRPWGVVLFWTLLCVVVPATVFRAAMAALTAMGRRRDGVAATGGTGRRHRAVRAPRGWTRAPSRPRPMGASPGTTGAASAGRGPATGAEAAASGPGPSLGPAPGVVPGPDAGPRAGPAPRAVPGPGTGDTLAVGTHHDPGAGHGPDEGELREPDAGPRGGPTAVGGRASGAAEDPAPASGAAGPGRAPASGGGTGPEAVTDPAPGGGTGAAGPSPAPEAGPEGGDGPGAAAARRGPAAREGLPWFAEGTQPQVSAPSEDGPTKGTT